MNITVAGSRKEYPDGLTVSQLIEAENVQTPMYVSVSLNDEFVKSGELDITVLKDNDSVEFLYFMGGGR
jgi:sulfur carrier protein